MSSRLFAPCGHQRSLSYFCNSLYVKAKIRPLRTSWAKNLPGTDFAYISTGCTLFLSFSP